MPLADALRRFARETGYDVVFPEHLVEGRRSAPVRAPRGHHDALLQMLAGSGLVPRFTRRDAFVLEAIVPVEAPDLSLERIDVLTTPEHRAAEYRWYGDKLVEASLRILRRSRELGFRTYDFTLYVWLSGDGRIVDLDGYGSAKNQEALGLAKDVLRGALVGTTPPARMPQPVGLRITAQ